MKNLISLSLAAICAASVLVSCAGTVPAQTAQALSASDYADVTWLEERLGEVPDGVTVGTADSLGIDMTAFEDDGYLIRTESGETVVAGKTADGLDRAVRKYAKAYEAGSVCDVTYHEGYRVEELRIGGADISEFTVVRPQTDNANVDFAISELVRLVEKATGVRLPVSDTDVSGHKITFTESADEKYCHDGYTYTVKNGDLCFEGAVQRGAMNGVWRFLEKELSWDGLMYGDSVLAESDLVDIPEGTTRSETPAFDYYDPYALFGRKYKNDSGTPNAEQNAYGEFTVACHGMQNNRFCDEDYNTKQICYTDEGRYEECRDNVIAYIERFIASGYEIGRDLKEIDIAQGDNEGFCTCKECRRVLKEECSNAGAMVRFSNRLADEINETYNGIYFKIFAYAGTNIAPLKTKPNEWIYVTFCFDVNCTCHKIDGTECTPGAIHIAAREGRDNALYMSWLDTWLGMTDQIYVWYYALDTALKQYNVFRTLKDDLQFLRDRGIKGIFWEAEFMSLGIQYVEHMVGFELNWNTDMSEEEYQQTIDNVLRREFGDGFDELHEYLDIQTTAQVNAGCWHCWGEEQRLVDEQYYANHYEEIRDLMDDAIADADCAMHEKQAKVYNLHTYYQGAHAGYHDAYLENDTEAIEYWCDVYQQLIAAVNETGFDIHKMPSWQSVPHYYRDDLVSQAWHEWVFGITGYSDNYYHAWRQKTPPIEIDKERPTE